MLKLVLIFATQILAAPPTSEDAAAYKSAKQHFNEGRYQEAASRFEELWEHSPKPKPKYLHYAAMAWAALGRDTHAILDWQRVLSAPETDEKLRASVNEFLVEAYKRAPAVSVKIAANNADAEAWVVTLTPAHGPPITGPLAELQKPDSPETVILLAPGTWTIGLQGEGYKPTSATITVEKGVPTSVELEPQQVPGKIAFALQPPVQRANAVFRDASGKNNPVQHQVANGSTVELPKGKWTVTIHAEGYHPYAREVTSVSGGSVDLEVALTVVGPERGPQPGPKVEKRVPHPKLALGLGIGAGVAAVAGGVLVGVGEIKIATADEPNSTKVVADNSDSFAQGAAILGGSLGLGLSSIVAKVGTKRRRWYVPLVGGLISAIGGGVWYGLTTKAQQAQLEADATNGKAEPSWITSMRANVYASTILTGLGAGMVIGATGGVLANRRTKRRRSARLQISPSGATIKIRF